MKNVEKQSGSKGAAVVFDKVTKQYGLFRAVDDVSLRVEPGEFVSLLGPSGSGKTTLLMMLAGFEQCTGGRITVGSRDFTTLPPNERDIGVVFQRYALFPHMTVADNIAFPLRMRGQPKATRDREVRQALEMVKLSEFGDRLPSQLSGGQQQRIALARAIVFHPQLILMDEPLGALDKKLRQHLQIEIKQLQQRLGATVLFVTHDQEEALTMSDRVAVMNDGRIIQYGSAEELYKSPNSSFVAGFVGETNFLAATVTEVGEGGAVTVDVLGKNAAARIGALGNVSRGRKARLAVRPENLRVVRADGDGIPGTVTEVVFSGVHRTAFVQTADGSVLRALLERDDGVGWVHPGASVRLGFDKSDALVFAE